MLQAAKWGVPSASKANKTKASQLSDDEIRRRIFANASVLFPSSNSADSSYEIVYGSKPRTPSVPSLNASTVTLESPWQYAMLVRRNPSGEYTPLIKGQSWSTATPWSMVLQGLLDVTATAIHKKFGGTQMPPLGAVEELPRYSPVNIGRAE
ncbi:hypothetical protein EJ03DRAFT_353383 [Teratosphaeria nubilosa]|uniref:Uncharacterized protein n=1 Tax=Teratosphaeria nubilosa TaxID=161662 RepID=A0A6G1L306_9PEZI|nr:hypothetical protein EJ03DRAFT_353383 [Teratosphaeria nubilosa]